MLLLLAPLAAWALYKPSRLVAPQWLGLVCVPDTVCVDDADRAGEAVTLYEGALAFVQANAGQLERRPRAAFCATESCFAAFGLDRSTAHTTLFGIIVGPRGWEPHYVRHELIHHLQMERLGFWKLGPIRRWRAPEWFLEGMAYALSEDPRPALPEPYQTYRLRFEEWYSSVGKERLWAAARDL